MLIAATSARALAQAARAAGYLPLVADAFADSDTDEAADDVTRIGWEFTAETLLPALSRLSEGRDPQGFVYGSGFEDRCDLLALVAERWEVIGNAADVVRLLKEPFAFAELCRGLAIPHPAIAAAPRDGWLKKKAGGAGGVHVRPAASQDHGGYFQEMVSGRSVSLLFLADGKSMQTVGFSEQWTKGDAKHPFRYGGAARPVDIKADIREEIESAMGRLVAQTGLKGLNSADFIVADAWWLIEINPRPGATLDIFRDSALFEAHVAACGGQLPAQPPHFSGARGAAVVYADAPIAQFPTIGWPDWACDRQKPGTTVDAGDPLCTIIAEASTAAAVRRLLRSRESNFKRLLKDQER